MGCGCGKKIARNKARKAKRAAKKTSGNIVRKRRISKLISVPGKSVNKKVKRSS